MKIKMRITLLLLALIAFASCADDNGLLFDGKSLYSQTERGRIKVVLPEVVTGSHDSKSGLGLDRLHEIARKEIPHYSARPAEEWQLLTLVRHDGEDGSVYYIVHFRPPHTYSEWIQVAIDDDGKVLARPDVP
ncbi:MAG: hypothetical protein H3C27_03905 [Opitutaceae bacterium]|nr:hypothetical protein [Opitutaceae bacterium]